MAATSHGVAIAAREWPKENAETALLIRGYPDDKTVRDELRKRLNQDYRVVSDDVRGSGEPGAPIQKGYSHQNSAAV